MAEELSKGKTTDGKLSLDFDLSTRSEFFSL